jgi:hypothetical protein
MATRKKPAKVSHAKVVYTMYLDFMRLAGVTTPVKKKVSHAKPPAKKKVKIVIKKKPPAKKKPKKFGKIPPPGRKPVFVQRYIKPVPPRVTRGIPIGGTAFFRADVPAHEKPPARETMPVSEHWSYFDADGGPVAPWEIDVGDIEGEEGEPEPEGVFADEDYSYADIEADWGGYEHTDTGYADENA